MKRRTNSDRRRCQLRLESLEARQLLAANVVVNEIHFDPNPKTEFAEFIELYNAGDETADLTGWKISDAVEYEFPSATQLAPDSYLIVAQNPEALAEKFGVTSLGPWTGKLNNSGETIRLHDADSTERDRVDYQLGFPWPTVGDEPGYSIELIDPSLDNQLGGSWRPSIGTEPRIASGSAWKFFRGFSEASDPIDAWRQPTFDDSSWEVGTAPIGRAERFLQTELKDARNNYTTVFLRKTFTIDDADAVGTLQLNALYDDGINVWINGNHVATENLFEENLPFNFPANGSLENKEFVNIDLPETSTYLVSGENVIAVQLVNSKISDSDLFFDAHLFTSNDRLPGPTPGAENSTRSDEAAPQIRQVTHQPQEPKSGEDVTVTAKVTDVDGVQAVQLHYQSVTPGDYIRMGDGRYLTEWSILSMRDDGTGGDERADDDVYTAVLPGQLQTHRGLMRYRVHAVDSTAQSVLAPYADDPQPNFAYFVYDGVPDWTAADRPGRTESVTFGPEVMNQLPAYHLIAIEDDVIRSQYQAEDQRFRGTMVYDGEVYDHIEFRSRGEFSTFVSGKNKWKFFFNRGHEFQARDNYGRAYDEAWRVMNFSSISTPWVVMNRGMAGLGEAVAYRLYDLAGAPSPNTNYLQFRVIDNTDEAPEDQYNGDLWGMYLTLEHPDGKFLDERDLPDGTTYKVEGSNGDIKNQGPTQPDALGDFREFMRGANNRRQTDEWWRENVDLDSYFTFHAINRVVNNMDIRDGWNHYLYHNPETNQWSVIPWDLDMLFVPTTHWPEVIRLQNMLRNEPLEIEYQNHARELQDLLFSEGQVHQIVDEYARFVNPQTGGMTMVDVDQFMWNYHPRTSSSGTDTHRGQFNKLVADYDRFQGRGGDRTLVSADNEGFAQWIKDFMLPSPGGGSDPAGYGADRLDDHARDDEIPETPSIAYVGSDGFAVDGLSFETSSFQDPQGDDTFAAMQWRLAEVTDPLAPNFDSAAPPKYEIQATWESDELATFANRITIPNDTVEVGHAYRVRVRMKDATGRWSHWSEPVQFTAGLGSLSDAVTDLRVTEVHYNPGPVENETINAAELEFIELTNVGDDTLDISQVRFDDGIEFAFADSSILTLDAGARVLLVRDRTAFEAFYGKDLPIAGEYGGEDGFRLNNGGEQLRLVDSSGAVIQEISYDNEGLWPAQADGLGSSLEIIDPRGGGSDPRNWRASSQVAGTPGTDGSNPLRPGDSNGDGRFDQLDIVQVLQADKYLKDVNATFAEGDWNNDGRFDSLDIVLALQDGRYRET